MKNLLLISLLVAMTANAQDASLANISTDTIINLPVASAWTLFTTEHGLDEMGYQQTSISLKLTAHVHAERKAGAISEIIDGTIASFDPLHMISWQWADQSCWSVLYFNEMGDEMTQIKWIDMCTKPESGDLNKQALAHRNLFDQLIRHYAPECHVCKEEREAAEKENLH